DMETQPVSVLVNVSSVHIPYSGVGKESVAQEDEIIEEIKLAVMDAARGVQRYVSGKMALNSETNRYKMIMRYTKQLSMDLSNLTGKDEKKIEERVSALVAKHYPKVRMGDDGELFDEVPEAVEEGSDSKEGSDEEEEG
ncbi:MAG: hypothetical protein KGH66_03680, partial [Candidatus Micrarchaeota archaeon]|nr:hypothetical protein [Candidatus Micrarchaeota archaeon]